MEIRRFGPGHRRPLAPPATPGMASQVIWSDPRAHVLELAFPRRGAIAPQTSPGSAVFVVISGGGWVQVGEERVPVHHGEAVTWPADVVHAAWTDGSEMRAIIVELPEAAPDRGPVIEGATLESAPRGGTPVTPGRGRLAQRRPDRRDHDPSEGEPW